MAASYPGIAIRPAASGDAEDIIAVTVATWLATYPNNELGITVEALRRHLEGEAGEKIAERIARTRLRIEMSGAVGSPNSADFVAVLDGRVIGWTCPRVMDEGKRRVGTLYVLPSFHGHGIGHLLLETNLAWHGPDQDVYLNVVTYNQHARRFYERHGFVLTGEEGHDEAAVIGGVVIPEVEMIRKGAPVWRPRADGAGPGRQRGLDVG